MKLRLLVIVCAALVVVAGSRLVVVNYGNQGSAGRWLASDYTLAASDLTRMGLPSEEMAKAVLSDALTGNIHPQWFSIPSGSATIRAFVVFPQRPDKAPVVVIGSDTQGMSDWLRAVGNQVAAEGFISVIPDPLSGMGPGGGGTESFSSREEIVRTLVENQDAVAARRQDVLEWAVNMPGSNGRGATLNFNFAPSTARIEARAQAPGTRTATFEVTSEHAWHNALAYLARLENPGAVTLAGEAQTGGSGSSGVDPDESAYLAEFLSGGDLDRIPTRSKHPEYPANFQMAARVVAESPRRGEWVDIPMASGTQLRTWISYPEGDGPAPIVLVFQPGPGMDMGEPPQRGKGANWLRGIADQLALEGFIAVLPDLTSGLGPNGGNFDSFEYPDDVGVALGTLSGEQVLDRVRAAQAYGLALPRANGRTATIGFCFGGGLAWETAAEVDGVNAAVVFYGGPPEESVMARIHAPVAAYYGSNDVGLAPRIEAATADMARLGKEFEVEVYDEATHVFLYRQDLSKNSAATVDSWPKAIAFMKRYTM